jgi:hypothetical protein
VFSVAFYLIVTKLSLIIIITIKGDPVGNKFRINLPQLGFFLFRGCTESQQLLGDGSISLAQNSDQLSG